METQRASVSNVFDFPALERRWQETVDVCRGNAEPSYRTQGRFTHNKYETAASTAIIPRDIGEALTFTRAFDLVAALHLLQIERPARSAQRRLLSSAPSRLSAGQLASAASSPRCASPTGPSAGASARRSPGEPGRPLER